MAVLSGTERFNGTADCMRHEVVRRRYIAGA